MEWNRVDGMQGRNVLYVSISVLAFRWHFVGVSLAFRKYAPPFDAHDVAVVCRRVSMDDEACSRLDGPC